MAGNNVKIDTVKLLIEAPGFYLNKCVRPLDKMSSQMLYRYILIPSEGIPEDEAAYSVGY